jgi:UDP-GlcNAc:undecaprenyl-phosphate GlcNAc-1-phosphate transferase
MEMTAIFLASFILALFATPVVAWFAIRFDILDKPDQVRKLHHDPTPVLGGLAVFIGIVLAVTEAWTIGWLPGVHIKMKFLIGMGIAGLLLVVGGALDDKYDLKPARQIIWPILAALAVIVSGIGIDYVTNPFGGQIRLDGIVIPLFNWHGLPYKITLLSDLFTFAWLMGMTYVTKFLDGLDGLVTGMTGIGAVVLAFLSLLREVSQPDTAVLAVAVAGAFFGFLIFNFHPARIFLGEGGSTLAGFLLGTLAIISGGKIATTLLILGLPLFDAGMVIAGRILRRRPLGKGDRSHLHFRLLELGLSHRQTVLFFYVVAAMFGTSTVYLHGPQKVVALGVMGGIVIGVAVGGAFILKRRENGKD